MLRYFFFPSSNERLLKRFLLLFFEPQIGLSLCIGIIFWWKFVVLWERFLRLFGACCDILLTLYIGWNRTGRGDRVGRGRSLFLFSRKIGQPFLIAIFLWFFSPQVALSSRLFWKVSFVQEGCLLSVEKAQEYREQYVDLPIFDGDRCWGSERFLGCWDWGSDEWES